MVVRREAVGAERVRLQMHAVHTWSDRAVALAERGPATMVIECEVSELVTAVRMALERLQMASAPDEYRARWGWDFPIKELHLLRTR